MAPKILPVGKPMFTESDGRALAVQLLHEIEQWYADHADDFKHLLVDLNGASTDTSAYDAACLSREPEILRRYLSAIHQTPQLERGFLCMLTEFIGASLC